MLHNPALTGPFRLINRIARHKRYPVKTDLARSVLGLGCEAPPDIASVIFSDRWLILNHFMNIDARNCKMREIIAGDKYFFIPDYQRPYGWEESHVEDFWMDLTKAFERKEDGYFLDKLIFVNRGEGHDFEVVDGQQRLTTTLILLAVLRDFFFNQELPDLASEIQSECIKKGGKYRLYVRDEERTVFENYILKDIGVLQNLEQSCPPSSFRETAIFLSRFLKEKNDELKIKDPQSDIVEYLKQFYYFLLDEVVIISVITDSIASAYTIFEVINTRGKDLETKDLLKNLLIRLLEGEVEAHNKQSEAKKSFEKEKSHFLETWREIEKIKTPMDELLRHHRMTIVGDRSRQDLFREISDDIKDNHISVDSFMNDWKKSVDAFVEIKNKTFFGEMFKGSTKKDLLLLENIGYSYWLPVLIAAWRSGKYNKEEFERLINGLERFCGLSLVAGYYSHGVLPTILVIIRDLNKGETIDLILGRFESFLRKKRVYQNIYASLHDNIYSSRWCRYVLAKYEYSLLDDSTNIEIPFTRNVQIEHILPQSMTPSWKLIFSNDEHDKLVDTLGNLTLLSGSMNEKRKSKNQSASNKSFAEKKKIYLGETNKDGCTAFKMTQEVCENDTWTPTIINERTEKIINRIFDFWHISEEDINDATFLKEELSISGDFVSTHPRAEHSWKKYNNNELRELLLITLKTDNVSAKDAKKILEILVETKHPLGRKELCDKLFSVGLTDSSGDIGQRLNKFSQLLSRRGNDHLRQLVKYTLGPPPVEKKDNYFIPEEYKNLVREVLNSL